MKNANQTASEDCEDIQWKSNFVSLADCPSYIILKPSLSFQVDPSAYSLFAKPHATSWMPPVEEYVPALQVVHTESPANHTEILCISHKYQSRSRRSCQHTFPTAACSWSYFRVRYHQLEISHTESCSALFVRSWFRLSSQSTLSFTSHSVSPCMLHADHVDVWWSEQLYLRTYPSP